MNSVFPLESLAMHENETFATTMKDNGYCIVSLDNHSFKERFIQWQALFAAGFDVNQSVKEASPYRSVCNGLAIGYRRDDEREFMETRLVRCESGGSVVTTVDPLLPVPSSEEYRDFVLQFWALLRDIGHKAVACMCTAIGVDPVYAWRLMDPMELQNSHSSSVLRICSYPAQDTSSGEIAVAFGAHTDTSFVTVAPCSSIHGLQMRSADGSWRCVETDPTQVIVFTGEIMQILTRHHYRAAVHRVITSSSRRISCPFIIRGCSKTLLTAPDDAIYHHSNSEAAMTVLSNLEGVTMKHIHKILDLRRARCRKRHENDDDDWVLCAYEDSSELQQT